MRIAINSFDGRTKLFVGLIVVGILSFCIRDFTVKNSNDLIGLVVGIFVFGAMPLAMLYIRRKYLDKFDNVKIQQIIDSIDSDEITSIKMIASRKGRLDAISRLRSRLPGLSLGEARAVVRFIEPK